MAVQVDTLVRTLDPSNETLTEWVDRLVDEYLKNQAEISSSQKAVRENLKDETWCY